ncbi:MHC class II transactivator-like [Carlito syrichta]|uniref:MHC class II transactivator-like n=1 Tax=Carlito syrichta TaxID=1868482 RepID=A0A3Q0E0X7_CARSF|nr:MHC class II transactivator-like [Carlito syrichta]
MNCFQAILPHIRGLLSSCGPGQVQALLDNLLDEALLSREYHSALLREPDDEALARKISLTLLEKEDLDSAFRGWFWSGSQAPTAERGPSHRDHGGFWKAEMWLSERSQAVAHLLPDLFSLEPEPAPIWGVSFAPWKEMCGRGGPLSFTLGCFSVHAQPASQPASPL